MEKVERQKELRKFERGIKKKIKQEDKKKEIVIKKKIKIKKAGRDGN